jgi:hypothetical protein
LIEETLDHTSGCLLPGTTRVIYLSKKDKQKLKRVSRKPYYHFIVDVSKGKEKLKDKFIRNIGHLIAQNNSLAENARISFVNSDLTTTGLKDNWKEVYSNIEFEGGFFLERAIRKILIDSYRSKTNTYPLIVVITDNFQNSILENDFQT